MTVNKAHLTDSVHNRLGLLKSNRTIESLLELMKQRLENGESILISRFGKFCVENRAKLYIFCTNVPL